jgi:tetratricopeptide (TPR) repeat protein
MYRISQGKVGAGLSFLALALAVVHFPVPRAHAADESNREIARAYANFHLEQKDYPSAVRVLRDHIQGDPEDHGAWNVLGLAYLLANQPKYAADSFAGAARRTKGEQQAIYLYNHADALARAGDVAGARKSLESATLDDRVAPSARAAIEGLAAGQPLPPLRLGGEGAWRLLASVGSGYDTNVLLVSDSNLATAETTGTNTGFVTPALQLQYSKPGESRDFTFAGAASFTHQLKEEARTYNGLSSSLSADWAGGDDSDHPVTGFGDSLEVSYLNTNGFLFYNWTNSLRWRAALRHGPAAETELELPLRYQRFLVEDGDDLADDRTGFGVRPAVTHRRYFAPGYLTAQLIFEKHLAKGTNYRANGFTLPLSWTQRRLLGLWTVLEVEAGYVRYYASANDRTDKLGRASLTFTRRLARRIVATLDYTFRRSISTVDSAQYGKHALGLTVYYEIF